MSTLPPPDRPHTHTHTTQPALVSQEEVKIQCSFSSFLRDLNYASLLFSFDGNLWPFLAASKSSHLALFFRPRRQTSSTMCFYKGQAVRPPNPHPHPTPYPPAPLRLLRLRNNVFLLRWPLIFTGADSNFLAIGL